MEILKSAITTPQNLANVFYTQDKTAGNSLESKFEVAIGTFAITQPQTYVLRKLEIQYKKIKEIINQDNLDSPISNSNTGKLYFWISETVEDEICLSRKTTIGVSTLIIDEEGVVAYSFIAFKGNNDVLKFYNLDENLDIDYETVMYDFLSN